MFKLYLYNEKVYFQSLLKKKKKKKRKRKRKKERKKKFIFNQRKWNMASLLVTKIFAIVCQKKYICNRSTRVESYMMPDLEEKADLIDFS